MAKRAIGNNTQLLPGLPAYLNHYAKINIYQQLNEKSVLAMSLDASHHPLTSAEKHRCHKADLRMWMRW
jgi:hypothetical protein